MTEEQQYTRGFNHGYKLAKYLPDFIAKVITGIQTKNDYISGLFSGREEYELEQSKEQMKGLEQLRNSSKDRGQDLDRDI